MYSYMVSHACVIYTYDIQQTTCEIGLTVGGVYRDSYRGKGTLWLKAQTWFACQT